MTWSRIFGGLLMVLAFAPAWAAKLHIDDARFWDSQVANPDYPDMIEEYKAAAVRRRHDARLYAACSVACAAVGLTVLILPSYLKRRRAAADREVV